MVGCKARQTRTQGHHLGDQLKVVNYPQNKQNNDGKSRCVCVRGGMKKRNKRNKLWLQFKQKRMAVCTSFPSINFWWDPLRSAPRMIACDVNENVCVCLKVCVYIWRNVCEEKREGLVGPVILLTDVHACVG